MRASYSAFMAPELVELLVEGKCMVPWLAHLHPQGVYLVGESGGLTAGPLTCICPMLSANASSNLSWLGTISTARGRFQSLGGGGAAPVRLERTADRRLVDTSQSARSGLLFARGCKPMSECDLIVETETFGCEFLAK
jgi:hypothetical protein